MVPVSWLRTWWIGALCLLLTAQVTATAALRQSAPIAEPLPDNSPILRLQEWARAVQQHEVGAADAAFFLVAGWSIGEVQDLWLHMGSLLRIMRGGSVRGVVEFQNGRVREQIRYTTSEQKALSELGSALAQRPGTNVFVKRGASLHTDIALFAPVVDASEPSRRSRPQRAVAKLADGEQIGVGQAAPHWDLARGLIDGIAPVPVREEAARLWYRATLAHMVHQTLYDMPHFEAAVKRFPDDGDILFFVGCMHEAIAGPKIQSAVGSLSVPIGTKIEIGSAREELKEAEGLFRRALRGQPDLIEARVRLGRVLGALGEHDAAAVELRRVVPAIQEPLLSYYGDLFLGTEEEALGNADVAHASYTRANEQYPEAQAPLIALSRLARARGDRAEALRSLERAFALVDHDSAPDDPWWLYYSAPGRTADALLAEMRRSFTAPNPQ